MKKKARVYSHHLQELRLAAATGFVGSAVAASIAAFRRFSLASSTWREKNIFLLKKE